VVAINLATVKHKYQVIFALAFLSLYGCAATPDAVVVEGLNKRIASLERSLDERGAKLEELENKFHLLRDKLDSESGARDASAERESKSAAITPPAGLRVIRLGEKGVLRIKGLSESPVSQAQKGPLAVKKGPAKLAKPPSVEIKDNRGRSGGAAKPSVSAPAASKLTSAKVMYEKARALFLAGKFSDARTLFLRLTTAYPESDLADNAFYWSAESYYRKKDFRDAVVLYKVVIDRYPRGNKAADALMGLGATYDKLGESEKARAAFKRIERDYPESSAAKSALKRLKL